MGNGSSSGKKNKTRTQITILGQEYTVRGAYPSARIKEIAAYVDDMMQETRKRYPNLPVTKLAVLTSLNLAEELFRAREDYDSLLKTLEEEQKKAY